MIRLLPSIRHRTMRSISWLWAQKGTPGERARGVAAGVFCGCYPFFGLQTILSLGVASLVRGNHLLAAAGTLISNPFTYLPLYWFNYQLGCWLLGPNPSPINWNELNRGNLWEQGWMFANRLLLGSSLVGALLSLLLGATAYVLFQRRAGNQGMVG